MCSSRIAEKYKRALVNLIDLCKGLRTYSIPVGPVINARILKLENIVKKICKSTALIETRISEYVQLPAPSDSAKSPAQAAVEEEVAALKAKLLRNSSKFKLVLIALAKDLGVKEKESSTLSKSIDDTVTNLCKWCLFIFCFLV